MSKVTLKGYIIVTDEDIEMVKTELVHHKNNRDLQRQNEQCYARLTPIFLVFNSIDMT